MNVRPLAVVSLLSLLSLLTPAQVEAAGLLLARGLAGEVQIQEARVVLSRGPARSTAWYQFLFQGGNATELLWLIPVPSGAAVDVAATSFFDGLEEATAPRVLAPAGLPPGNQACIKPTPEVVSSGEGGNNPLALLGQEVFSEPDALVPGVEKLGYTLSSDAGALVQTLHDGGRLLALRMKAPLASASTVTVRVHGNAVDLAALSLLRSPSQKVPFVLWLVGTSRAKVQGVGEVEIEPSALRWLGPTETNYTSLRQSMLEKFKGTNVILEVAGPGPLRDLTALPGGQEIPAFLDAYLRRAFERGEASGDLGEASDKAQNALDETHPDGCPRGDLLPAEGFACTSPGTQTPLVPSPGADDLSFIYSGNAALRWVSRVAGLVPAASALSPVSGAFPGGDPVSLLLTPASVWDGLCSPISPGGQEGAVGAGGKNGGMGAEGTGPSGSGGTEESTAEKLDAAAYAVDAGCSCANVLVQEGCNGSSSDGSEADSESCSCSDTSSTEDEDSSSEGCSCEDSSSEGEGESCSESDTGDEGSEDSCSGSEGSGGSDACGSSSSGEEESDDKDCSVSHRGRRSPRPSKWLVLAAATVLPLRRWTRPRDRKRREELVVG
ncbi:MAG: DUF2330 domain-containing protein [Myxococcales bacterium]|nr:DUF2330 domain-containing protein [Polyangiaceae bacterium]MDW8247991.1 DUF2330 domain-containing protein [Myxococcales bacterium]